MPNHRISASSVAWQTLAYLLDHLEEAGLRVSLVHGDIPDEDRVESRRRFNLSAVTLKHWTFCSSRRSAVRTGLSILRLHGQL